MNQTELIATIAKAAHLSGKQAKDALHAVLGALEDALMKGKSVRTTLGTFAIGKRGARMGRNPKTGETIQIKASKTVRFRASKSIKDRLNKR